MRKHLPIFAAGIIVITLFLHFVPIDTFKIEDCGIPAKRVEQYRIVLNQKTDFEEQKSKYDQYLTVCQSTDARLYLL